MAENNFVNALIPFIGVRFVERIMMESLAFWPSFFKMLFALAVVLGLLVGAMYFFRRILQQPVAGGHDNRAINVVAARYLGPKSSIMLVEVLGKFIVIGLANNQMSHLATITDPEALEKFKYSDDMEKKIPSLVDYCRNHKIVRDLANLLVSKKLFLHSSGKK